MTDGATERPASSTTRQSGLRMDPPTGAIFARPVHAVKRLSRGSRVYESLEVSLGRNTSPTGPKAWSVRVVAAARCQTMRLGLEPVEQFAVRPAPRVA